MKIQKFNFLFTCWNCAFLMCNIVVDKRLHGVPEVKDMQDGKNVGKISLPDRDSDTINH